MADILEVTSMLGNTAEPKRQFRWILALKGIDAYTCRSFGRPSGGFSEVPIDYINIRRFISGKWQPSDLELTLWDPIAPSAAQKVNEWVRLNYEISTGRAGYFAFYSTDFDLKLLDPPGGVAETWKIVGAWPKAIDFGTLNYASDELVECRLTLRFNQAFLQ